MKVINLAPHKISTSKIKQAIALLPKEYRDIDIPIHIVSNKLIHYYCGTRYWDMQNPNKTYDSSAGYFVSTEYKNMITDKSRYTPYRICLIIKARPEAHDLLFVNALYHEIRHAYQCVHMQDVYQSGSMNYKSSLEEGYDEQFIERDANRFAAQMIKKHRKALEKIFEIEYNGITFKESNSCLRIRKFKKKRNFLYKLLEKVI